MNKHLKFTLAAFCAAFSGVALSQNTFATPANSAFTDDNFYACVVDGYNHDHTPQVDYSTSLTDSQLADITYLSCKATSSGHINNVAGIEHLISLETFELDSVIPDYSTVSSIDLSANTKLTNLTIHYQPKLNSLDLSNNLELTSVSANYNGLGSINLKNNKKLTSLSVSSNYLTSLDVSNNSELQTLSAYSNSINELDISKNNKLNLLRIDNILVVTGIKAIKQSDGNYKMDLSGLKYIGAGHYIAGNSYPSYGAYSYDSNSKIVTIKDLEKATGFVQVSHTDSWLKYKLKIDTSTSSTTSTTTSSTKNSTTTLPSSTSSTKASATPVSNGSTKVASAPNTGLFTGENNAVIIGVSVAAVIGLATAFYLSRYGRQRFAHRVKFTKK